LIDDFNVEELKKIILSYDCGIQMTEYPFFYDGMTAYEFEVELDAYMRHGREHRNLQNYVPLWKQRGEEH